MAQGFDERFRRLWEYYLCYCETGFSSGSIDVGIYRSAARPEVAGVGRPVLLYYGLPGLVTAIPTIPIFTLLPTFYAQEVGLGLAVTGAVLFAGRALDLVTDPLVGRLADRGGGRDIGRLVLLGALLGAPALVLLMSPPEGAGAVWLLVTSALLLLGWTLVQIPYLTWGARLSAGYHERTRLTSSREGATLVGILLSASLPAALGFLGLDEAFRMALLGGHGGDRPADLLSAALARTATRRAATDGRELARDHREPPVRTLARGLVPERVGQRHPGRVVSSVLHLRPRR